MVARFLVEGVRVGNFTNFAEVHDHHAVAHSFYYSQVMGDEHHCQFKFVLHVLQKVEDLCLNADIQSRNWLIADKY